MQRSLLLGVGYVCQCTVFLVHNFLSSGLLTAVYIQADLKYPIRSTGRIPLACLHAALKIGMTLITFPLFLTVIDVDLHHLYITAAITHRFIY